MRQKNLDRSVTIRIPKGIYDFLLKEASERSISESRKVKISEIIREKIITK